ncbi:hypothetical protein TPCV2_07690 [Cutibacterium avidum]|nr:hypothetical protein A9G02_09385 [Cutibacterium avidum]BCQ01826.1 hypothetical protein TPCV4_02700 [Cutibacterium avidum]
MNRYGSEIQRSWEMACPDEVRQMDNPEEFFESLGQQASRMISDLTTQLAGPDEPGETYFHKVGRLNRARMQAEEIARAEIMAPPEVEEDDLIDPSLPTRTRITGTQEVRSLCGNGPSGWISWTGSRRRSKPSSRTTTRPTGVGYTSGDVGGHMPLRRQDLRQEPPYVRLSNWPAHGDGRRRRYRLREIRSTQ